MKPKKSTKKKGPILDNDGESTMTPRKSPPIKKKRGPKPGKSTKKKKKYVRKRKEEEFRIFFPPPRLNPQLKTPFKLHNTTCTHHDWITDNLNLPKYASYQTGWRVSYITMKSIILLDSKRATFLKLFNLYKKRGIKKAIFGKDRRGVAKIDLMPKKWSFSRKLPDIDGLEEEEPENEKLLIKLVDIKTEPPQRPTRHSILRKFHKKPSILTISHEKSRRKPRKRRYMRCPGIPGRRMIEFRRNRNEKRGNVRMRGRNWEKVWKCPLRIRILRSQLIRKRECRVETSALLKWIQKEKMEEWKDEEQEKKKRRIEAEEDVAWDKYVESQTDEWNLENVIPGELSLEVEQEFKHKNRNWTVVEKKGCDEQGFQYLLVLTEELNGVQRIRYDRSAIDYKFRKMRNEKGGTDEYITSLPVYHPKPPKTRYPAFPGENFEKERELERRRVEDEDKVRRDAELEKEDKRMFKKVIKRETMIKRYRDRIRREIWIRRRRALQNQRRILKTPKTEEIDPLQPSTSSGIVPLKGILKSSSSRHQDQNLEKEDVVVKPPHINGIMENGEKIEKIDEIVEKNRKIPLKNGRRLRRRKVKIEEEEEEADGLIKEEEIKMEIGVNSTMNDCNQVISLTNCHVMPSTSSDSSHLMEFKTELTETNENTVTDDTTENQEKKRVTFKLSNQQKLSKIWRPMGWQIKEMLRTIGVGRGYKIRSKRSRRNERIRLNNFFHGVRHNFKSPPTRIDEFEKGVDIREQPIPFVEEFILDDHSIVAFSSHQDLKTYEQAVSLRTEEMIDEFWRVQCVKNIEKAAEEKRRKDELKAQIEKLDLVMRQQTDQLTDRIDRENVEAFETAGRHVEKIINDTGDCPFDTLDEYFSIAAEFQKHEELRNEEEIEDNEADVFERELEGLISVVKNEYSIVDLMMRILRNRHLLTMRLVVSGINQSPIDRQLLLKKIRKLLIELKKKRESLIETEKLKNERREKRRESMKNLEKRVLRKAQKLVMKRRKMAENGLKINGKMKKITEKRRRKWTIHVEIQEKSMKKRRKRRKSQKKPVRDLRWSFKHFGWYNGVGRRNFQLHRNSIRKALAWGFKWEEIFGETEFERVLREYVEYEEMDIKNQVSIDRKIELITKIKTITLNDVRARATAMQNQQVEKAVELMIKSRMQQIADDHRKWVRSDECERDEQLRRRQLDPTSTSSLHQLNVSHLNPLEERLIELGVDFEIQEQQRRIQTEFENYHLQQQQQQQLQQFHQQQQHPTATQQLAASQQQQQQQYYQHLQLQQQQQLQLLQHQQQQELVASKPGQQQDKQKRKYTKRKNALLTVASADMKSPGTTSLEASGGGGGATATTSSGAQHLQLPDVVVVAPGAHAPPPTEAVSPAPSNATSVATNKRSASESPPGGPKVARVEDDNAAVVSAAQAAAYFAAHPPPTSAPQSLIGISAATQAQIQIQQAQQAAQAAQAAAAQATQSLYINTGGAPSATVSAAAAAPIPPSGPPTVAAPTPVPGVPNPAVVQQQQQAAHAEALRILQGGLTSGLPFLGTNGGNTIPYFTALQQQFQQLNGVNGGGGAAGIQFGNAALGPQLAGAALLAAVPGPPVKKTGRWSGMHVKIATDIQNLRQQQAEKKTSSSATTTPSNSKKSSPQHAKPTVSAAAPAPPATVTAAPVPIQQPQPTSSASSSSGDKGDTPIIISATINAPPPSAPVAQIASTAPQQPQQPPPASSAPVGGRATTTTATAAQTQSIQFTQFPPPQLSGGPTYSGNAQLMAAAINEATRRVAATPKPASARPPSAAVTTQSITQLATAPPHQQQRPPPPPAAAGLIGIAATSSQQATPTLQQVATSMGLQPSQVSDLATQQAQYQMLLQQKAQEQAAAQAQAQSQQQQLFALLQQQQQPASAVLNPQQQQHQQHLQQLLLLNAMSNPQMYLQMPPAAQQPGQPAAQPAPSVTPQQQQQLDLFRQLEAQAQAQAQAQAIAQAQAQAAAQAQAQAAAQQQAQQAQQQHQQQLQQQQQQQLAQQQQLQQIQQLLLSGSAGPAGSDLIRMLQVAQQQQAAQQQQQQQVAAAQQQQQAVAAQQQAAQQQQQQAQHNQQLAAAAAQASRQQQQQPTQNQYEALIQQQRLLAAQQQAAQQVAAQQQQQPQQQQQLQQQQQQQLQQQQLQAQHLQQMLSLNPGLLASLHAQQQQQQQAAAAAAVAAAQQQQQKPPTLPNGR